MTIALPTLKRTRVSSGFLALVVALGLIATIAAAVALTSTYSGGSSGSTAVERRPVAAGRSHSSYALYLVADQEQANLVQWGIDEAARERDLAGIPEPNQVNVIFKVTTAEEERDANDLLDMWLAGEPDRVYIVDKRN
jgi:hypothetical protein